MDNFDRGGASTTLRRYICPTPVAGTTGLHGTISCLARSPAQSAGPMPYHVTEAPRPPSTVTITSTYAFKKEDLFLLAQYAYSSVHGRSYKPSPTHNHYVVDSQCFPGNSGLLLNISARIHPTLQTSIDLVYPKTKTNSHQNRHPHIYQNLIFIKHNLYTRVFIPIKALQTIKEVQLKNTL